MKDSPNVIFLDHPLYKELFESLPGLFLVLLPDLSIYAVSDEYALATMTKRSEIIGKHLFEVFPDNPSDVQADGVSNLRASLQYVLRWKLPHSMAVQKYDIRRPDGTFEERYWSPMNKPVLNDKKEVSFIIHKVEDVTSFIQLADAQKDTDKRAEDLLHRSLHMEMEMVKRSREIQKMNDELEKRVAERTSQIEEVIKDISDYKFALDASSIVAVTDQKGIIQHVNDNFCAISGYTKEELINQDHRIVNSGYHSKEFIRNLWRTIASGKIWKGELRNLAKNGTIYWVDTTIVPFLDEKRKPFKYLAIRADITTRKQAEEVILKMNEDLENKITQRTLELTNLLERMQSLNEMKSRFVSMASHEFRTPLSTMLSSLSLVEAYQSDEQLEKRKKHINRIRTSIRDLIGILNDFLSIDKLEQGIIEMEPGNFDLDEFARELQEEVNGILKSGQQILYHHTGEKEVVVDKKILKNILLNLLSNASKYSAELKDIRFCIEVSQLRVSITIADEGMGIPLEDQPKLFGKFYRASNAAKFQGTGLGLNIVKRYLELLEGEISFVSKEGVGTTFKIEFPQNQSHV